MKLKNRKMNLSIDAKYAEACIDRILDHTDEPLRILYEMQYLKSKIEMVVAEVQHHAVEDLKRERPDVDRYEFYVQGPDATFALRYTEQAISYQMDDEYRSLHRQLNKRRKYLKREVISNRNPVVPFRPQNMEVKVTFRDTDVKDPDRELADEEETP